MYETAMIGLSLGVIKDAETLARVLDAKAAVAPETLTFGPLETWRRVEK